ncbi:hypothetical protein SC660_02115, partial [Actinotignum timonense]|nr:hypothetical protein [Actinotignum timonense]
ARTVKFPDASVAGEPITQYAPAHPGGLQPRALTPAAGPAFRSVLCICHLSSPRFQRPVL